MLAISLIRENQAEVIRRLAVKNFHSTECIHQAITLDDRRREIQQTLDDLHARSNMLANEIGILIKSGKPAEANSLKEQTLSLKSQSKELETSLAIVKQELEEILLLIPNLPHPSVPTGKSPEENEITHQEGDIPVLPAEAMAHWDLVQRYHIIDFEMGVRITGAGFPVYLGQGAALQRALISFFLDHAIKAGYTEVQPPYLVSTGSAFGTGQLPDKDGQMYRLAEEDLYLIPTAEVPVTNLYRGLILNQQDLPVKHVAYSACFRREAGSWGKEVRGLNRLHQFDKVEIVQIVHPDCSYTVLEEMKDYVAGLIRQLGLPFRIVKLCGGDLSFTSAMTYDMEVYAAAQQRWLEVSSVSNFETFQANRMKLRIKDENGKIKPAHTLNGSALALPRIVAALLENNQTPDGIAIPEVLVPYTGFQIIR